MSSRSRRAGEDADDLLLGLREQADRFYQFAVLLEHVTGIPDSLYQPLAHGNGPGQAGYNVPAQLFYKFSKRQKDQTVPVEDLRSEDERGQPAGALLNLVGKPGEKRTLSDTGPSGDHHRPPMLSRPGYGGKEPFTLLFPAAELPRGEREHTRPSLPAASCP